MAASLLKSHYPWTKIPLLASAPMRLIAEAPLAVAVSRAGGIGFLGAGTDPSSVPTLLQSAADLVANDPIPNTPQNILPVGIGFILWGSSLSSTLPFLTQHRPAAVWLFAPDSPAQLADWARQCRIASPDTRIWIQVGSVADALAATRSCNPDVLVLEGADAGGHGLSTSVGISVLVPEVADALQAHTTTTTTNPSSPLPILLAAGGIANGRGVASTLALGAAGAALGTRFLASREATIAPGYQAAVLAASDGGQTTVRTRVYDKLRGTDGWPAAYNGRGVVNQSWADAQAAGGEVTDENRKLYQQTVDQSTHSGGLDGWGTPHGRLTTYAGAGVGLVKKVMPAGEIVKEIRAEVADVLRGLGEVEVEE